jgi:hypothetical protein
MTGITPRLPGRLVHSHRPLKTFYLARHYSKYSTLLYYLLVVCVCVCIYDVTSCLSVLITASGLQGEKPLANGIK